MPMSPHRLAWAGILATIVGLASVPAIVVAQASPSSATHPLVATASQYEGMYEGECWIFVKKVVLEALGIEMGFDYRLGYLDSGAVEVSIDHAAPGDIIQIADDNYTEPDADYPGLHTFIISEVVEYGVFNGWDSNSNWDGIVRYRESYDPRGIAGRYPNLNFRIYRFPTPDNPVDPAARFIAPKARQFEPGDTATVVSGGDVLNLRADAGLDKGVVGQLPDGAVVTVTGGPVRMHGHTWVSVRSSAGSGWVASEYLAFRAGGTDTESASTTDGGSRPLLNDRTLVPFVAIGN
jgi:hypothetical protein